MEHAACLHNTSGWLLVVRRSNTQPQATHAAMRTPPHRISNDPHVASVTVNPVVPRRLPVVFCVEGRAATLFVAAWPQSRGGLVLEVTCNGALYDCVVMRVGGLLTMTHNVTSRSAAVVGAVVSAAALLAATYCATGGDEPWAVNGHAPQAVPFGIGRGSIVVAEYGAPLQALEEYSTRGRNGAYKTQSVMRRPLNTTSREVDLRGYGTTSHPQLALLREIVAAAATGELRLVGALTEWQHVAGGASAAPTLVVLKEVPAGMGIMLAAPVITITV